MSAYARPAAPRRVRAARVLSRVIVDGAAATLVVERVRLVSWHPWGPGGARPRWEWRTAAVLELRRDLPPWRVERVERRAVDA